MTSSPILLNLAGSTFSCELIVMDEVLGYIGHAQPLAQAVRPGLQGRVEGKLRPDCIWSRRLAPRCGQLLCLDGAGAAPWLAAPWLAAPWTTEPRGLCRGCSSSSSQARVGLERGSGLEVWLCGRLPDSGLQPALQWAGSFSRDTGPAGCPRLLMASSTHSMASWGWPRAWHWEP